MWPGWRDSVVQVLLVLGAAVGLVLLVACASVANLLLTRAASRRHEIVLRLALGSGRGGVVRQLMAESVLLAVTGGAVGLLFARLLIAIAGAFELTPQMHMNLALRLDGRVFLFTFLLSLAATLIFGLIPAFSASRVNLSQALKESASRSSPAARARGLRRGIVAAQVAFAFMALVMGGLFVRSLVDLGNSRLGFDPNNVLAATAFLSPSQYSPAQGSRLFARLLDRISISPGVASACLNWMGPLTALRSTVRIAPEGEQDMGEGMPVQMDTVSPGCFQTLNIPMVQGRDFTPDDNANAPLVAIVNRTLAESLWPHENPIGKFVSVQGYGNRVRVIGVVADIKYHTVWEAPEPFMYLPLAQKYVPQMSLLVRTSSSPMGVLPEVRQSLAALDATVPLYDVGTMQEQVRHVLSQPRLIATLLSVFGAIALLLAVAGVYGVVSYSVAQRAQEIGIRMAIGAQRENVVRLIVGEGVASVMVGTVGGIVAALAATRLAASLLYGVKPADPLMFVAVSLLLIGVALLACYIPARRAARLDPMTVLRQE
jgi:putative ABC transport system permease protein